MYHSFRNVGNARIFNRKDDVEGYFKEKIKLTKLADYIPYLKSKNLALIKLDIEGSEARALEGGIDLIIKYHIPFIFMEFIPKMIKLRGTDPELFLKMFENNGYKISNNNFFEKNSIPAKIVANSKPQNLYLRYQKFIE